MNEPSEKAEPKRKSAMINRSDTPGHLQPSIITLLNSSDTIAIELGGDTEAQLAAMVLTFAHDNEERADEARRLTESMIREAGEEQVQQMRDQADDLRWGGVLGGLGTSLAGAATLGGGIAGLESARDGASDAVVQCTRDRWQGASGVLDGSGQFANAYYTGEAGHHEANATAAGNELAAAERRLDQIEADLDDADDLEDSALDFYEQSVETQAATNQTVVYRG
jgi:hypothetical protein